LPVTFPHRANIKTLVHQPKQLSSDTTERTQN
jgi:hypothetical protein